MAVRARRPGRSNGMPPDEPLPTGEALARLPDTTWNTPAAALPDEVLDMPLPPSSAALAPPHGIGGYGGPPATLGSAYSRPIRPLARVIPRERRLDAEPDYGPSDAARAHARRATESAIAATIVRQHRAHFASEDHGYP